MTTTRKGPFILVTVNTAPERARKLIRRMIEEIGDSYDIEHVANCSKITEVEATVRQYQPNVLFSASMWTPEEATHIAEIAESIQPGIITHAIPQGLQVERGPDAVVDYLLTNVPRLLEASQGVNKLSVSYY